MVTAEVLDLPKPGVIVQLPHGIEGFVPLSQLARGGKRAKEHYQIGESIELRVVKVDYNHRRITLSELPEGAEPVQVEEHEPERRPERERTRERRPRPKRRPVEDEPTDRFTLEDHLRGLDEDE